MWEENQEAPLTINNAIKMKQVLKIIYICIITTG